MTSLPVEFYIVFLFAKYSGKYLYLVFEKLSSLKNYLAESHEIYF